MSRVSLATRTEQTLSALLDTPRQTAKELNLNGVHVKALKDEGLIQSATVKGGALDSVRTGSRGRPAHRLVLTDKGRKRARRFAKASA